jgi:hypothetical protein
MKEDPKMDEIRKRLNMDDDELNILAAICSGMRDLAYGWNPLLDEMERHWIETNKDRDDFE